MLAAVDNVGDGLLRCDLPSDYSPMAIVESVVGTHVPITTLDAALHCPAAPERRRVVAGIKMDVESHEAFVVRGGKEFLAAHRPPIVVYEGCVRTYIYACICVCS